MNQSSGEASREPAFAGRGPMGGAPVFNVPFVVIAVIGALVAVHFAIAISPRGLKAWMQAHGAVSPRLFFAAFKRGLIFNGLSPLVTHIFIHANIAHLLMNSVWLLAFGAPVARRLEWDQGAARGALSFVLLFVLSGAFGGLAYIAAHPGDYALLVGASGGVSGLLGGLVRFAFHRPVPGTARPRFAKLTDRSIIAWSAAIVFLNVVVGLFGGFILGGGADIAWEAHLGGFFFGLLAFPLFDSPRRR